MRHTTRCSDTQPRPCWTAASHILLLPLLKRRYRPPPIGTFCPIELPLPIYLVRRLLFWDTPRRCATFPFPPQTPTTDVTLCYLPPDTTFERLDIAHGVTAPSTFTFTFVPFEFPPDDPDTTITLPRYLYGWIGYGYDYVLPAVATRTLPTPPVWTPVTHAHITPVCRTTGPFCPRLITRWLPTFAHTHVAFTPTAATPPRILDIPLHYRYGFLLPDAHRLLPDYPARWFTRCVTCLLATAVPGCPVRPMPHDTPFYSCRLCRSRTARTLNCGLPTRLRLVLRYTISPAPGFPHFDPLLRRHVPFATTPHGLRLIPGHGYPEHLFTFVVTYCCAVCGCGYIRSYPPARARRAFAPVPHVYG